MIRRTPITSAEDALAAISMIEKELETRGWLGGLSHVRCSAFRPQASGALGLKQRGVHGRLNAIRRFRNRVAHHEPIFHRPLEELHEEIMETIGWMCPNTAAWARHHSRFPAVFAAR